MTRLRSQNVTLKQGRGQHIKYRPYAFTEHGILMLSSVLKSERAVSVNIEIMRTFVRLRHMLASNLELARKLQGLERKYDQQFKVVFEPFVGSWHHRLPRSNKSAFAQELKRSSPLARCRSGTPWPPQVSFHSPLDNTLSFHLPFDNTFRVIYLSTTAFVSFTCRQHLADVTWGAHGGTPLQ